MAQAGKKKIFDGRYEILSIVGRGARSVVYHARHVDAPSAEVALKVLLNRKGDNSNSERLRKEALAMVSSRHKYVIRLDDFHSIDSLCYLSMEFAPNADLRKYISERGTPLRPEEAERFLLQILEALSFIHQAGIVHRDLKPDNILVMDDSTVKLGDFGVAVLPGEEPSFDELQKGIGTMDYMAPEVLEGITYDSRSDVYSLGVSFYELISGVHPFEDISMVQQLEARKDENVPPLQSLCPGVPVQLATAIMQAMSYDPADRFPSAKEFLQSILINRSSQHAGEPVHEELSREPRESSSTSSVRARRARRRERLQRRQERLAEQEAANTSDIAPTNEAEPKAIEPVDQYPGEAAPSNEPPTEMYQGADDFMDKEEEDFFADLLDDLDEELEELAETEPDQYEEPVNVASPYQSTQQPEGQQCDPSYTDDSIEPEEDESSRYIDELLSEEPETIEEESTYDSYQDDQQPDPFARTFDSSQEEYDVLSPSRSSTPLPLVVIGIFVLILVMKSCFFGGSDPEGSAPAVTIPSSQSGQVQTIESGSLLPQASGDAFAFPYFAPGVYSGTISNVVPGKNVPLSILSFDSESALVVIVGIPGWTPQLIAPQENGVLHAKSNGIVLRLTGEVRGNEVYGSSINVLTGQEGSWTVRLQ